MATARESFCCHEVDAVKSLMEGNDIECVTAHPGMEPACVNPYTLEVAWIGFKQQYGLKAFEGPYNKKMRHSAYRQFIRWTYGYCGQHVRVIIPSCVVSHIRSRYPISDEENVEHTGFKDS